MHLGIEIGGTKLQLGVGQGGQLEALERRDVDLARGAQGIQEQIEVVSRELFDRFDIKSIGYGFGGPVDGVKGEVVTSHQVAGWDSFPLRRWTEERFRVPVYLGNDCDAAALAEARFGAGANADVVFYVTVGTGVGGGLVIDGHLHGIESTELRPLASAEIGHLRPGLAGESVHHTVESISSGMGMETRMQELLQNGSVHPLLPESSNESLGDDEFDLTSRCGGDLDQLTARMIGEAASYGNSIALRVIDEAVRTLGWAIAQVVSITAPRVVVVGGGVSLMGDVLFYDPLRAYAKQYVFPPLENEFEILSPTLGEEVVVHGAVCFAEDCAKPTNVSK